jgi:hypothetical protein
MLIRALAEEARYAGIVWITKPRLIVNKTSTV